ncbi:MAG: protein-L-isoaspartate(D-aspartate) O-methyltransferase [Verrucomicrobia bacterium]|nr:protein-L-isoaspartate(D-aspartate) O-methyltransferase [Verrucomicrobiota bacterium]
MKFSATISAGKFELHLIAMKPVERMVREQIAARGILDERVLMAMREVPRHEFVPDDLRDQAYEDRALPIGWEQTISQPYIVAFMTEALEPQPEHRVLEIGTGSGYQAAVLSLLVREVYTIEIVEPLAARAAETLRKLGYDNVEVRSGDGHCGWPEESPFDFIIVTCAPEEIPAPLVEQLREGGRMMIPVGASGAQELILLEKHRGVLRRKSVMRVAFVPMTGKLGR